MTAGLGSWPARRAAISPDRTAIIHGDRRTTYGELRERVTRLAARLRAAGVTHGDRVAYLGLNHPSFVETMFATLLIGGIFVPLNTRLTAGELGYMLEHSGTSVLIRSTECAPASAPVTVSLPDYEAWLAAGDPAPIEHAVDAGEPAFILYTSGTTGRPKGAVLTHANVIWNCFNLLVGVDVAGDEVTLIGAPLFHVAALNQCLLPTFLKGGVSVIMPKWNVDRCFDLIAEHRVTWMFGVTTMFAEVMRSPRWHGADLSSLRSLLAGGAPVPETLIHAYQERGLAFSQGYGMTETAPGATVIEAPESGRHAGSAGAPVFFADVRCVRPDLTDTEPGEPGELIIRGPNVSPGYWHDPAATEQSFAGDGWFRSGDLGVKDANGYYRILDRLKDMYISGGENVYPAEVEAALFTHPAVGEAAVVGVPDGRWGEVGRAFIAITDGQRVEPDELRAYLIHRLAKYKVPAYITIVPQLPRTGSDKIRKAALKDLPLPG
ncbi:acyl-CoA synthetase [Actinoplanes sp. CA-131856]